MVEKRFTLLLRSNEMTPPPQNYTKKGAFLFPKADKKAKNLFNPAANVDLSWYRRN
jgi:hypothetical protein